MSYGERDRGQRTLWQNVHDWFCRFCNSYLLVRGHMRPPKFVVNIHINGVKGQCSATASFWYGDMCVHKRSSWTSTSMVWRDSRNFTTRPISQLVHSLHCCLLCGTHRLPDMAFTYSWHIPKILCWRARRRLGDAISTHKAPTKNGRGRAGTLNPHLIPRQSAFAILKRWIGVPVIFTYSVIRRKRHLLWIIFVRNS
jgi:hypothetical protein